MAVVWVRCCCCCCAWGDAFSPLTRRRRLRLFSPPPSPPLLHAGLRSTGALCGSIRWWCSAAAGWGSPRWRSSSSPGPSSRSTTRPSKISTGRRSRWTRRRRCWRSWTRPAPSSSPRWGTSTSGTARASSWSTVWSTSKVFRTSSPWETRSSGSNGETLSTFIISAHPPLLPSSLGIVVWFYSAAIHYLSCFRPLKWIHTSWEQHGLRKSWPWLLVWGEVVITAHESTVSEIKQSCPSIHSLDGVPHNTGASLGPLNVQEPPHQAKRKEECFLLSYNLALRSPPPLLTSHPLSSPPRLRERSLEAHMFLVRAPAAAHLSYINPLNPRPGLIFSVSHTWLTLDGLWSVQAITQQIHWAHPMAREGEGGGGEREVEGELGSVLFGPNILVLFGLDLCNDTDRKAAEEKTSDRSPLTDLEPRRDRRTRHTWQRSNLYQWCTPHLWAQIQFYIIM